MDTKSDLHRELLLQINEALFRENVISRSVYELAKLQIVAGGKRTCSGKHSAGTDDCSSF